MFDLIIGSSMFWYMTVCLNTLFLGSGIKNNLWHLLLQFLWVFVFSFGFVYFIQYTKLYTKKSLLWLVASLMTLIFFIEKWLGNDFFNYFSLFFTNILYCMMIFYSLHKRNLL